MTPYLLFDIARHHCALQLEQLVQIEDVVAFQHSPLLTAPLLGTCMFHGRVLFGIDLAPLLGAADHRYNTSASMLVVQCARYLIGLLVDQVSSIVELPSHQRRADHESGCISGYMQQGETMISILNPVDSLTSGQLRALELVVDSAERITG